MIKIMSNRISILKYLYEKVIQQDHNIGKYDELLSSYRKIMLNQSHSIVRHVVSTESESRRLVMSEDKLYMNVFHYGRDIDLDLYCLSDTDCDDLKPIMSKKLNEDEKQMCDRYSMFKLRNKIYDTKDICDLIEDFDQDEFYDLQYYDLQYYNYQQDSVMYIYFIDIEVADEFDNINDGDNVVFYILSDQNVIKFGYHIPEDTISSILMWKDTMLLLCRNYDSTVLYLKMINIHTKANSRLEVSTTEQPFYLSVVYDNCLYMCDNYDNENITIKVIHLPTMQVETVIIKNRSNEDYRKWFCTSYGLLYMTTKQNIFCVQLPSWDMIKPNIMNQQIISSKKVRVQFSDNVMKVPNHVLSQFDYFRTHINFNKLTSQQMLKLDYDTNLFRKMIIYLQDGTLPDIPSIVRLIEMCEYLINEDIKSKLYIELYLKGYHPSCITDAVDVMSNQVIDDITRSIFLDWFVLHKGCLTNDMIKQLCDVDAGMIHSIMMTDHPTFKLTDYMVMVKEICHQPVLVKM